MADNTVTIHIDAKTDDAKKGIDGVNTSIGRMGPESQNATSHVSSLGDTLKSVGSIATGFIAATAIQSAVTGITTFATGTVKAAVDLGESLNAVNVIFRESAQQILDWGANNATQFGLSQRAFNALATPLGALLKNSGMGLDDVAKNTINLTKRAADMASVFNTEVADALNAINSGLRGEGNPLERYGVGLKAATVEARALADSGKGVAKELTDQELALARLSIIFEQTADTEGDFANTSKDLANAQRIANAEMEKLQATVGAKLLPVMLELQKVKLAVASAVVDKLLPALDHLQPVLNLIKDSVVQAAKPFIDALLPAIKKVVDFIKDDFAGIGREFTIAEVVRGKIVPAFKDMYEIIKDVLNFLKPLADFEMAHLQGQIEAIRGAFEVAGTAIKNVTGFLREHQTIVAAVVAAYVAYKAVLIGGAIYTAVATGIGIMTVAMTTGLIPALIALAANEGILTAAQVALNIAMSANPIGLIAIAIAALVAVGVLLYLNFDKITAAAGYLFDRIKEAGSGISDAWNSMVGFVTDKATALLDKIKGVGTGIYDAVVGAFTSMVEFVKTYWPEIISLILLPFFPIVALATDAFGIRTALGMAWDWIREKTSQFINSIIEFFQYLYDHSYLVSNTVDAIVKYFTDMRDLVLGIWNAVTGAIEAAWKFIYDVSSAIVKAVVDYAVDYWEMLKARTTAVWDAITGAIEAAWDYIYDIVSSVAQKVVDFLSGVWDAVTAAVSTCWELVKQIVGDAMSAVWDYVRDRLNDVVDRFKSLGGMILSALGDVGSLLYGAGRSIVMGLWNGIMSMWESVVNVLRRLKDAAIAAALGAVGYHDDSRPSPGGSETPTGMASGGVVKATPGGILARLGEGGQDEAVIPLGRGAGSLGSTTINNYSITLSGVITDPVATGQAVADALNRASIITGPLVLSSAVRT